MRHIKPFNKIELDKLQCPIKFDAQIERQKTNDFRIENSI